MAGLRIVVCLPGEARGRLEAAIGEAMAPFHMDFTRGDELDIWDHWAISYFDGFVVRPGCEDDPRLILDDSDGGGSKECAGGPRDALNFSANTVEAGELAGAAWDLWHTCAVALPPPQPRRTFHNRPSDRSGRDFYRWVGEEYRAQPLVGAFDEGMKRLRVPGYAYWFLHFTDPVVQVGAQERETFIRQQTRIALPERNVLTLGGWWYEDGGPGIHGQCHSPARCPHKPGIPTGPTDLYAYLRDLPGDTLLVNLRCHV
jgi:hypothetical protein